jgi:hypothetical protein
LFRDGQGIVHFYAEIPNSAFNLRVSKEQLNGTQVSGAAIDQGRLGPPK